MKLKMRRALSGCEAGILAIAVGVMVRREIGERSKAQGAGQGMLLDVEHVSYEALGIHLQAHSAC